MRGSHWRIGRVGRRNGEWDRNRRTKNRRTKFQIRNDPAWFLVLWFLELPMRIVGVDPGLNITGYAVVEKRPGKLVLVEAGMIRGRSRGDLAARLLEIHEGISDVIATLKPELLAIEELYSHY